MGEKQRANAADLTPPSRQSRAPIQNTFVPRVLVNRPENGWHLPKKALIVEIKGEETDETQAKHKFFDEWVKAINGTKSFGTWTWTVITDPKKIDGHLQEIS